jgi:sugar lactone lactonase YvrE
MAADATHLFWSEFGRRIFRVPKAGGDAEVVSDIDGHPGVLALDATHVYATLTDTNQLAMVPKTPGKGSFLPNQSAPIWIATDATHVYWINQGDSPMSGELRRAPLGDFARSEVLADGLDSPVTLALSGTDAYFVAASQLFRFPKSGGGLVTVRSLPDETKAIATYSDSLYLTSIAGLMRIRDGESVTLDTRTTLALALSCSGVFATGWLVPAMLKYSP